jgi:hypothetical protein
MDNFPQLLYNRSNWGKTYDVYIYDMTIFWLENLKGRDALEDLGVGGKRTLEWILGK